MGEWKQKRTAIDAALKKLVIPELRSQGFRGSFPHFRKTVDDHIEVIGFQFSQWGTQFYIVIGVCGLSGTRVGDKHYPTKTIKYNQTQCQRRIGELPFDYEEDAAEEVASRVVKALQTSEEHWNASIEQWRELSIDSSRSKECHSNHSSNCQEENDTTVPDITIRRVAPEDIRGIDHA